MCAADEGNLMKHSNWKKLFSPHIWQRGADYYHNGHVGELQYHGNKVTAEIEGTDVYSVSVTLDASGNSIERYSCNCPYGEDGTPCKHLAALLCALDNDAADSDMPQSKEPSIEQAIAQLSDQQMRTLLLQFAQKDSFIRDKILLAGTHKLPVSQKRQWKQDLRKLTASASDRHGFIDYAEAFNYCSDMQDYLEDRFPDLLDCGLTKDAFDLTCLVFQTSIAQVMDDSDGGLSMLVDACMDAWSQILQASDPAFHRDMLAWFQTHDSDYDLSRQFLDEYIFDAPWDDTLAPGLLKILDQKIQQGLATDLSEYRLENLIVHRIRWMERSGADHSEIDSYMEQYRQLPAIREQMFLQAMYQKDYESALSLLNESTELDKDKPGLLSKYSRQKMEIYETQNDISALRKELEHYVFSFRQDDLVYAEKLKSLLSETEWIEMRDCLLNSSSMKYQTYPLMSREGMYEQMMAQIERHTDVYALEQYESKLKEAFPLRCMNVYIRHLEQAMSIAANRKAYWSVIQTLKKLRQYPNGKAVAQKIAAGWKQKYPRRSSMLDELKKAGF